MIQCTTISISVCLSKFIYFNGFITAFKFANLFLFFSRENSIKKAYDIPL